ncbi:hypothetical protein P7C70_g9560, partial [Phenoliferia sp. Uapishka_3]
PGLGPGGHASEGHLPTVHRARKSPTFIDSFYAKCRYCDWKTSVFSTPAAATRLWRNRHAAVHGITTWDLALFHPALPPDIVPASVARKEGVGLVYFSNRLLAKQIFDYAALIGISRYYARSYVRLNNRGALNNQSWSSSFIPADEVALLYRRTRFTPSVSAFTHHAIPSHSSANVFHLDCFAGVSRTGFNAEDQLLEAVGFDFDPVTLGSALWFWIYGVRSRYLSRLDEGKIDEHDEGWEDYRVRLYQAQVNSIPFPHEDASSTDHPTYSHDPFLLEVTGIIVELLNTDTATATGADHFHSQRWLSMLGNGGQEIDTWQQ